MDLTTLSDVDLDAHRLAVLSEMERRDRAASIPEQIESLTRQYVADGHDPAALAECVAEASASPVVEVI